MMLRSGVVVSAILETKVLFPQSPVRAASGVGWFKEGRLSSRYLRRLRLTCCSSD